MPYLFNESKLNYSGNKVAVRNLIAVCDHYNEVYSNVRAQLTLAIDSVASWHSIWNGAFLSSDVSLNGADAEHIQFLRQLSVILDVFYKSMQSIVTASSVPLSMETVSQRYIINDAIITRDLDGGVQDTSQTVVYDETFVAKNYRELSLKFVVGRVDNIGVAFQNNLPYDFQTDISGVTNRYLNGRYAYKIGVNNTEIIEIDLFNKTLADVFENAAQLDSKGTVTFGEGDSVSGTAAHGTQGFTWINVARSLQRLKDQLNFSGGLLEDSRHLFEALLD